MLTGSCFGRFAVVSTSHFVLVVCDTSFYQSSSDIVQSLVWVGLPVGYCSLVNEITPGLIFGEQAIYSLSIYVCIDQQIDIARLQVGGLTLDQGICIQ